MSPDPDPNDIPEDENVSDGPVADKGGIAAPMHGTDRPASGPGTTPGVSPDAVDRVVDEGGRRELDLDDGTMDTAEVTGGESVVEAEYEDRGPATHLGDGVDADAAADVGDASAGDRLTGTGFEAGDDDDRDGPAPYRDEEE